MMSKRLLSLLLLLVLLFPSVAPDSVAQEVAAPRSQSSPSPVMFIENVGQFAEGARFQVHGGNNTMWLAEDAMWLTVAERSTADVGRSQADTLDRFDPERATAQSNSAPRKAANIKLSFVGANSHPRIEPFDRLDTVISYFIGNDPDKWRPDVPVWGGVRYVDLYPGVDLEIIGEGGQMVQRLAARPDADLSAVQLRVEGADAVTADGDALRLSTAAGEFALPLLRADGLRVAGLKVQPRGTQTFDVPAPFAPARLNSTSQDASNRQSAMPESAGHAVANPQSPADNPADLLYGTFLGGSDWDRGNGIAVDGAGSAYVMGVTESSDFPTTPGAFDTSFNVTSAAFVVKLNPAGSGVAYATFLGGSNYGLGGEAIAVDGAGSAYVTGWTLSSDFPTTPGAFDTSFSGTSDAFVVKLDPAGSGLAYGTFLGGSDSDGAATIAVDGAGSAYVTGQTSSSDIPTTPGAFDTSFNGGVTDAFVVKLNPAGSALVYGTFLGGSDSDGAATIAVDGVGSAYVMGGTTSGDFPTTPGALDTSFNDRSNYYYPVDVFVVKLNPAGNGLDYATFLGGSADDYGFQIAVDGTGSAYLGGWTTSDDFPTTPGAFDIIFNGYFSAFVVKLNPAGNGLAYATFLDGTTSDCYSADGDFSIAVDGAGSAYVTSTTYPGDFPITPGAFDTSYNGGGTDAFVVKLNPAGSGLAYATFLGGSGDEDCVRGIAVDGAGRAYVVGFTESSDFPTTPDSFDPLYNGIDYYSDAFVVKLAAVGGGGTHAISGRVTDGGGQPLAGMRVSDGTGHSATSDGSGNYTFNGLAAGMYTLRLDMPTGSGYTVSPLSRTVTVPPDATGQDFTATLDTTLVASPGSVPADDSATSQVVLTGAPVGHEVRLSSSLVGSTFAHSNGTVSSDGQFVTTIRSATPGTATITAHDVDTDETFPASASVTFTPVRGGTQPPPSQVGDVVITSVRAQHPLDARYLQGIPLQNRIDVTVDWKGATPGRVDFILNGARVTKAIAGSTATHWLDMGRDLAPGRNSLRVLACSQQGSCSLSSEHSTYLMSQPQWMVGFLAAGIMAPLVVEGSESGDLEFTSSIKVPAGLFKLKLPGFMPDSTEIDFAAGGTVSLPLTCGKPLKISRFAGVEADVDIGGITVGGEFKGTGAIEARDVLCEVPTAAGTLKFELRLWGQKSWPVIPFVVNFVAPGAGDGLSEALRAVGVDPQLFGGEIYVQGSFHGSVESGVSTIGEYPYLEWDGLRVGFGPGIEAGYNWDLTVAELKVWLGADGTIELLLPNGARQLSDLRPDRAVLQGEAGYLVRALFWQKEGKLQVEWAYPPRATIASRSEVLNAAGTWHLITHSSVQNYAVFSAPAARVQSFQRRTDGGVPEERAASTTSSVLVSNVYTYTEPSLAVTPSTDDALLLWVHDDLAKPVGQAQEIEFSRWDGSAWSTPAGVTNDNKLDGAPQVAWTGDGKGLAVWQRLNDTLPITATFDITTAKKIEIAMATYDPAAGTWSPVALLTNNSALDMTPQLARNAAGNVLAAWRQNAAGLLSGTITDTDRIVTAFYGSGWTTPATAVDGIPGLVDLSAGYGNGAATLAFTRYFTPTASVTPTLQLFTAAWDGAVWSAPVQRTDDSLGHTDPQVVYNAANEPLVVWLAGAGQGQALSLRNLATGAAVTLTLPAEIGALDEFRVVQDAAGNIAAVFTAQASQRDLFVAFYDQAHNLWGNPVRLTDDPASESYPAPALDAGGRLLMGYAATAIVPVTQTTTVPDTGEVITYTLPTEGRTDLVTLSHAFVRNLTLATADLALSDDHPAPGGSVVISATVQNTGDLALDGVAVGFYDGDPAAGGTLIATRSLPAPLAAGFTNTLTTIYTLPTTGGVRTLYAVADPAHAIAEANEADNTASLAAFGPDLAIASAGVEHWGGSDVGLVTVIRNLGTTASPATTVAFYRDTITGTLTVTDVVPPLTASQTFTLTTPWNYGNLAKGSYPLAAAVNPGQLDFSEVVTTNNTAELTLDVLPDLSVNPLYLWGVPLPDGRMAITVSVANFGSVAAPASQVDIYVDGVFTDSARLTTLAVPMLDPAGQAILQTTWDPTGPGEHTIYAVVNPSRTITETTWANNVASTAGAAPLFDLAASRSVSAARLTWTHLGSSVTRYEVWRSSDPYFVPGASGSEKRGEAQPPGFGNQASYLDAGALGTGGTSYFYAILPISASGIPYPPSNRVGIFNFALMPGSP